MKRRVSILIILVTLAFGTYPLNFVSRNDLRVNSESKTLEFHVQSRENESPLRAIAFTEEQLTQENEKAFSIKLSLQSFKRPNGLGMIATIFDGDEPPSLIIAQWQNHLVIRSRRSRDDASRGYREIGLRDCLDQGQRRDLLISSDESGTRIFLDGVLAKEAKGFRLLDPNSQTDGQLIVGNNAQGTQPWTGNLEALSIYDYTLTPDLKIESSQSPIIEYDFSVRNGTRIPNQVQERYVLKIPASFKPLSREILSPMAEVDFSTKETYADVLVNIFGFVPLSLVIYYWVSRRQWHFSKVALASLFLVFASSLTIELTQVFLTSRNSSTLDLICNTTGGALAILLAPVLFRLARTFSASD